MVSPILSSFRKVQLHLAMSFSARPQGGAKNIYLHGNGTQPAQLLGDF